MGTNNAYWLSYCEDKWLKVSFCMNSTHHSVWHRVNPQKQLLAVCISFDTFLHGGFASAYYFKALTQGLFLHHQGFFSGGREGRSWGESDSFRIIQVWKPEVSERLVSRELRLFFVPFFFLVFIQGTLFFQMVLHLWRQSSIYLH